MTFLKMKNSEIDKVCPNCKLMFNSFYCMLRHFERIKCKTDHRAVEAPPDLVIEINNEETKKLRYVLSGVSGVAVEIFKFQYPFFCFLGLPVPSLIALIMARPGTQSTAFIVTGKMSTSIAWRILSRAPYVPRNAYQP